MVPKRETHGKNCLMLCRLQGRTENEESRAKHRKPPFESESRRAGVAAGCLQFPDRGTTTRSGRQLLDLNKIVSSTYNPRKDFPLGDLAGTCRQHLPDRGSATDLRPTQRKVSRLSMANSAIGLATMAGLKFIPALVRELSDAEAERCRHYGEPPTREDVTPREEAAA